MQHFLQVINWISFEGKWHSSFYLNHSYNIGDGACDDAQLIESLGYTETGENI